MSTRSASPPLPPFGIRNLNGTISITRTEYDNTIKSVPDAKLLYLDDDDGELITVGSGFELGQRLEDPVQRYSPPNGKLVHIFDIKQTAAGLAPWRQRGLYPVYPLTSTTSTGLRLSFDPVRPEQIVNPLPIPGAKIEPVPLEDDEDDDEESDEDDRSDLCPTIKRTKEQFESHHGPNRPYTYTQQDTSQLKEPEVSIPDNTPSQSSNFLDGIEEHLSGLANVLQLAANTLQKAADKTRETDTSVVEDILKGVKDILTEVGTFGVEAYKDFSQEIAHPATESVAPPPLPARPVQQSALQTDQERKQKQKDEDLDRLEAQWLKKEQFESAGPVLPPVGAPSGWKEDENHGRFFPRVRFSFQDDSSFDDIRESAHVRQSTPVPSIPQKLAEPSVVPATRMRTFQPLDDLPPKRTNGGSILDDSSEDADFTARYPPLRSVRRARSTIESSYNPYRLKHASTMRDNVRKLSPSDFYRPTTKPTFDQKSEATEPAQKPLPGAWPDAKNESVPTLPMSDESSGAFFNRMTGRNQGPTYGGIHRANTTACSNPASRLNGPFDPGFPYEPSKSDPYPPTIPFRPHRRSNSPSRKTSDDPSPRSKDDKGKEKEVPTLCSKRSMPNFAQSARSGPITLGAKPQPFDRLPMCPETTNSSKYESHQSIKHHRSVPHFRPYVAPPPRPPPGLPLYPSPFRMSPNRNRPSSTYAPSGYLTGGPPPTFDPPPTAPFSTIDFSSSTSPTVPLPPAPYSPQLRPTEPAVSSPSTIASHTVGQSFINTPAVPPPPFPPRPLNLSSPMSTPPFNPFAPRSWDASPASIRSETLSQTENAKNKFDACVEKLQMCGFGLDDDNLKNRLHVYAVAADGNVEEAVEMIEEDRKLSTDRFH